MSGFTFSQQKTDGDRTFLRIWSSQTLSVTGTAIAVFTLQVTLGQQYLDDPARLARVLSVNATLYAVTFILVSVIAGSLADRRDRRQLMQQANLVNAVLSVVMAAVLAAGHLSPLWTALYFTLNGALVAVHGAAFESSLAQLVSDAFRARANALQGMSNTLGSVLAPSIAALLLLTFTHLAGTVTAANTAMLALDALTFLLCAAALHRAVLPQRRAAPSRIGALETLVRDVRQGAALGTGRRGLVQLMAVFALGNLSMWPVTTLLPLIAAGMQGSRFGMGAPLAVLETVISVSILAAGAAVATLLRAPLRPSWLVTLPTVIGAALQVAFGVGVALHWPLGVLAALLGLRYFAVPLPNAVSAGVWQQQVPPHWQGRVLAFRRVVTQVTIPVSALLSGVLASRYGSGVTIAVLAALPGVFALACQLFGALPEIERRDAMTAPDEDVDGVEVRAA